MPTVLACKTWIRKHHCITTRFDISYSIMINFLIIFKYKKTEMMSILQTHENIRYIKKKIEMLENIYQDVIKLSLN